MRLGIDYGTVVTRAVLAWPDGRWLRLLFGGSPQLPSAVYLDADGTVVAGEPARRRGTEDRARFVAHPKQHIGEASIAVGDNGVEVIDLIAATLRLVAGEAARVGGGPPDEVVMLTPSSWGPRRRTVLRRAAARAGLTQPSLVDGPIAVAAHLLATGTLIQAGSAVLLCDVGAGRFEASVVQRTSGGFEVLSTVDSAAAAGLAVDAALADHLAAVTAYLTAPTAASTPDLRQMPLGAAHAAVQALAHTPAVAVPTGPGPPIVVDQPTLHTVTLPVLTHARHAVQTALAGADLAADDLAGVYCYGDGLPPTVAADALTGATGPAPVTVPDPEQAALLGAVGVRGAATGPPALPTPPGKPSLRTYAAVALPAAGSVALFIQATATALPITDPQSIDRALFVIADWGEYAVAALLVVQAAAAAAILAAAQLAGKLHRADPDTPPETHRYLARFLPAAATVGATIAGLYATAAALWHGVPNGPFLRATLLAAIPAALGATAVGLAATRRPRPAAATWLDWLTIPPLATAGAAAGIWLIQFGYTSTDPFTAALRVPGMYLGAALFGTAIGFTLPVSLAYQVLAAAPLALIAAILTAGHATGTLAGLYTLAVTGRLLARAAQLALGDKLQLTPTTHGSPPSRPDVGAGQ